MEGCKNTAGRGMEAEERRLSAWAQYNAKTMSAKALNYALREIDEWERKLEQFDWERVEALSEYFRRDGALDMYSELREAIQGRDIQQLACTIDSIDDMLYIIFDEEDAEGLSYASDSIAQMCIDAGITLAA